MFSKQNTLSKEEKHIQFLHSLEKSASNLSIFHVWISMENKNNMEKKYLDLLTLSVC